MILDVQEHASSGRKKGGKSGSHNSKLTVEKKSDDLYSELCGQSKIEIQNKNLASSQNTSVPQDQDTESLTYSNDNSAAEDSSQSPSASVNKAGSHRAGFDAFMTGYIFAFFSARYGNEVTKEEDTCKGYELGMDENKNKLYLVGKDIPLQVTTSSFSKPSKAHLAKIAKIRTEH